MSESTQFAYRTLKGLGVVNANPVYEPVPGFDSVTIIDASQGHAVVSLPTENVYELGFSPLGTFIITWQRPSKDESGDAVKNLKVWRVLESDSSKVDGETKKTTVGGFVQKSQTGWNLQYTHDEGYCARVVTNEVQFYLSQDLTKVWKNLRVEGVVDFAISPGRNHSIAVFVPERKGQPAAVKVFNFNAPSFDIPVSQKSFFKGDKVQLKWNDEGSNLIVLAQTEVDKSGKSYYGETTLYLLSANGGFDSRIDLDKEGPIHDVTWSPKSQEFGVIYGYMPAKTTIFNLKAVATHNFALGPRNTIIFSPHGRFVLVAGFGNLAGQMDIYDLEKDYQKMCTIEASNASVCEWSPDGQHILTATTSPRLRVDNGVRIWHISGGLMYNEDLQELYHVTWRPQKPDRFPSKDPLRPMPAPHASALAYLGTVKTPSKAAGAYRPPGARGQITPLAFRREDEGGAAFISNGTFSLGSGVSGFGKSRRREVPGAEAASEEAPEGTGVEGDEGLSKAALKNKKKREAKKAKEIADKSSGLDVPLDQSLLAPSRSPARSPDKRDPKSHARNGSRTNNDRRAHSRPDQKDRDRSKSRQGNAPKVETHAQASTEPPETTVTSPGGDGTPHDKKVRALLKKLRAIDDLKMRRAGGEKLEGTQIKKMDTEDAVRKELEDLGWKD